ncbi:MAG: PhoH family protein [Firmicutes bacterium]|nr:PhoH family protein [Candidatus Fermentithermobacillaceae bacterium]
MANSEKLFVLASNDEAFRLFGSYDQNLTLLEDALDVKLVARGRNLLISGPNEEVAKAEEVINHLMEQVRSGKSVTAQDLRYALRIVNAGEKLEDLGEQILTGIRGKVIGPRTQGQKEYVKAIAENPLTFGIGPAGTGKTYLAVAMAVRAFRRKEVERIILTRPAVEAGERLGFLPGDIQEKVNPYLRPLYDALFDMIGLEAFEKYMQKGLIEVAPLAYMRGRTLESCFVILDEAQNTTPEQMKMFLTRLGVNSKAVVTGDITQIDLPKGVYSGLEQVRVVLKGVEGVKFVYLTERDVVRHELVSRIVKAYERFEAIEKGERDRIAVEGAKRGQSK